MVFDSARFLSKFDFVFFVVLLILGTNGAKSLAYDIWKDRVVVCLFTCASRKESFYFNPDRSDTS